MKQLVEFTLENGGTVLMEVEDPNSSIGVFNASSQTAPQEVIKITNKTFEEYLDVIRPIADTILNKLNNLCNKPQEIEVSFGISIDLKAGMFISANTGSNFNVTFKWGNKNQ